VIQLGEIWRQRLWVWIPPTVFLIANLVVLAVYQFGYGDRVGTLQQELREQRNQEKAAKDDKLHVESLLQQASINRKRVENLYSDSFSTRKRRLTSVTAEVEALAGKAGLVPKALTFPEQEVAGYGLIKHSFVFNVTGNYVALRQFINLLEQSDSFLTLEGVTVFRTGGDKNARGATRGLGAPIMRPPNGRGLSANGMPGLPPLPTAPASNNAPDLGLNLALSTLFSSNGQNLDAPRQTPGRSGS
jgi:Tfp pilus assembly protein PilO